MFVLGCTASNGIDIHLGRILGADIGKVEATVFPDGEMKVRVPDTNDKQIILVQSTHYPQERNLFELLLAASALKDRNAEIMAVIPYLAYARQNRSFYPGEAISINVVLDMLKASGISSLITVNPHRSGPLGYFGKNVLAVGVEKSLAKYVGKNLPNPSVLAPDRGSLDMAKGVAGILKCEYSYIEKHRDTYGSVSIREAHGSSIKGKDIVIFDDIISTGSTIAQAARYAYSEGASSVCAAGIHLVMADGALDRLNKAGVEKVFGTNTIPCEKADVIDISDNIGEAIEKMAGV